MRFEHIAPPATATPLTEIQVEGTTFDLHEMLRFIGLTYGPEDETVSMGWSTTRDIVVRKNGASAPMMGLEMTWSQVSRFEVSFQPAATTGPLSAIRAGALEYFEFHHDPEATLVFFFENGTVRVSGGALRGEIILDEAEAADKSEFLQ